MFCGNCGKQLVDGAKFCPECGAKVFAGNEQSPRKRIWIPIGITVVAMVCLIIVVVIVSGGNNSKKENSEYFISQTDQEKTNEVTTNKTNADIQTNSEAKTEEPQIEEPDVNQGPQNYTSTTNPQLSTMTDTALVQINGAQYVMDDNGIFLSDTNCVEQINIKNIAGQYTIVANIPALFDRLRTGFTTSQFDSVNCFIQLENFYDSSELDIYGSPNYWAGNISTEGMDASYFKTTDMTVEQYDTSGITAFYFHIVTEGPTTGKEYDIEILAVSDLSDDEPAPPSNLCAGCAGTGNCFACSGRGKTNFFNAVTHTTQQKDCTVCAGTGKCSICHGSGQK